jgi:predicted Fe-Mo cluster-binding NifX family protein
MPESGTEKRIAIPSAGKGGLDDICSPHFGKCQTFTVLTLVDGQIMNIDIVENPGYQMGHCMKLIGILKEKGVDTFLVGGMGRMAFKVCNDLGIDIYCGLKEIEVKDAIKAFLDGRLHTITLEQICNKGPEDISKQ